MTVNTVAMFGAVAFIGALAGWSLFGVLSTDGQDVLGWSGAPTQAVYAVGGGLGLLALSAVAADIVRHS